MTKKYELNAMELELVAGGGKRNKTEKQRDGVIKLAVKGIFKAIEILLRR